METNINLKNIKLFPIYKLFAYDLLFYYAINMLFMHNVKGISIANIVLLGSLYSVFQMLFQIPSSFIVDKLSYKKSMNIGNILCTTSILTYIVSKGFYGIMLGDIQMSLGFSLKSVSESPFLFTVMKKEKIENSSAKVEAKGTSYYFYFEAVAAIISGYLYTINPYIPIVLCMLSMLTATIISFKFDESLVTKVNDKHSNNEEYINDMKLGFKFIFHSNRMKALLLFSCVFAGIVAVANNFSKAFLTDIEVSSVLFGIITSILSIISAIGSSYQDKFESKRKKKTLSHISIIYISVFLIVGLPYIIGFNRNILLVLGFAVFALQNFFKGSYRILMKKYLNNFTTSAIRSKIMSVYYLSEMLGTSTLLFLASNTLKITNIGSAYIIFFTFFLIIDIIVLNYMKTRLGLKPEQYKEKDINYKYVQK